jgi:hypothetical protein
MYTPPTQRLEGSPLEAASKVTLDANAKLAAAARAMGAGQKGSSRKKRGGAESLNASIPKIPEAGTIPGVSFANNHVAMVDLKNQLAANATGDKLYDQQPYTPAGGRRTKRKSKAKNGRRSKRTHRGRSRKSSHHSSGRGRTLKRKMAKHK